jgi:hypothetical protein
LRKTSTPFKASRSSEALQEKEAEREEEVIEVEGAEEAVNMEGKEEGEEGEKAGLRR